MDEKLKEVITEMQGLLDDLAKDSTYYNYIKEHKLELIDDKLFIADIMLDAGLLKINGPRGV
ncbi:MAG: hypothetical protein ACP5OE_09715 [Thermodesulfobium sp.]